MDEVFDGLMEEDLVGLTEEVLVGLMEEVFVRLGIVPEIQRKIWVYIMQQQ